MRFFLWSALSLYAISKYWRSIEYAKNSPVLLALTVTFFVAASIYTFNKRFMQAKRAGNWHQDDPEPPGWFDVFFYVEYATLIAILVLKWQYGVLLWASAWFMAVAPILETMGNLLAGIFFRRFIRPPVSTHESERERLQREIERLEGEREKAHQAVLDKIDEIARSD